MPDFYVSFRHGAVRYLAVVTASERPDELRFANDEQLVAAMEALGNDWQLRSEIPDPEQAGERSHQWLEKLAAGRALTPEPHRRSGTIPGGTASLGQYDGGSAGFLYGGDGGGYDGGGYGGSCGDTGSCGDAGGDGGGDG